MKKSWVKFFFLAAFWAVNVHANNAILDDVAKVKECWLKCPEEAHIAGERALTFFTEQANLEQPLVDGYTTLVMYYTRTFLDRGDYKRAADIVNTYLGRSLQPSSENELASVLVNQGIIYYSTNQIVLAENSYQTALSIFRRLGKKGSEGIVINNLANLSLERGRAAQAIEYYQKALPLLEEHASIYNVATTLNNLGIQLSLKGQHDLAEQYITRARKLVEETDNIRIRVQVIQAYAWHLYYAERYEQALEYMLENESFINDSELTALQAHNFYLLGSIQEKLDQFEQAENSFSQGLQLAKQVDALQTVDTSSLGLARVAAKQGSISEASTLLDNIYNQALTDERFEFAEKVQTELVAALSNDQQYEAAFNELSDYLEQYRARVEDAQENELSQYFALLETQNEKRKVAELERDNAQQALDLSLSESRRQRALTVFIAIALVLVSIGIWLVQRRRIAKIEAKSARDLLNRKNELLSEISHDLRTPITAIRLQIETLEHELATQPERTYALVYNKLGGLNRLIDDVFQLSKADSEDLELHLESTHAQQYMQELAESFEPQLAAKQIAFSLVNSITESLFIDIDRRRIEQVFANLISNTVRYTDSPGTCRLTLSKEQDAIVIAYEDSAPGVEDGHLERLFERLFRGEKSRNRALGGSGLGLSIVQAFVNAHRGDIKASHSELGGVRFDITLPVKSVEG